MEKNNEKDLKNNNNILYFEKTNFSGNAHFINHIKNTSKKFLYKFWRDWTKNDKMDQAKSLSKKIFSFLQTKNIWYRQAIWVKTENWSLVVIYEINWETKELIFDMITKKESEIFLWEDIGQVKIEKENILLWLWKKAEKIDNLLKAIDYIFSNYSWISKNHKLFTKDFWADLEWKTLIQLQKEIDDNLKWYEKDRKKIHYKKLKVDKTISELKEKYLTFLIWIWDKYENWAVIFSKSETRVDNYLENILNSKNNDEILSYISEKHRQIDNNDYQSTSVQESYLVFSRLLHRQAFTILKKRKAWNKELISLAKIITGRWKYDPENIDWSSLSHWDESDIDDNLRDQELSNEIIIHIMSRKNWVIDQLNWKTKIKIRDIEVWNKNTAEIVKNVSDLIWRVVWLEKLNYFLKNMWYKDIIWLKETDYAKLTIEQKVKVSTFVRLLNKVEKENLKIRNLNDLQKLFISVASDWKNEVVESLSSNVAVSFKSSKYHELEWVDAEVFELFREINWSDLFDLSDTTISRLKWWGKIIWTIWVGIAASILLAKTALWVVAIWAIVWTVATITSIVINPQWYDTVEEAFWDISLDLWVWTITWWAGWLLAKWAWNLVTRYWIEWIKETTLNTIVFAWDLAFLWLYAESQRQDFVKWIFDKKSVFSEGE